MTTNTIISISFLHKDERKIVKSSQKGKFRVPVSKIKLGRLKTNYENLTAMQIVNHEVIKNCDPVLTLATGEKVRVYHGGDNSYFPARSEGLILKHDNFFAEKERKQEEKKVIIPKYKASDSSSAQMSFPWYDEYDDDF